MRDNLPMLPELISEEAGETQGSPTPGHSSAAVVEAAVVTWGEAEAGSEGGQRPAGMKRRRHSFEVGVSDRDGKHGSWFLAGHLCSWCPLIENTYGKSGGLEWRGPEVVLILDVMRSRYPGRHPMNTLGLTMRWS